MQEYNIIRLKAKKLTLTINYLEVADIVLTSGLTIFALDEVLQSEISLDNS